MRNLTTEERSILDWLGECWNRFSQLTVLHPDDADEFRYAIHNAQNIVMQRPTAEAMLAEWRNDNGVAK